MSQILPVKFLMSYKISFSTNIRGHHVYKSMWKPENHKENCYKYSIYGNHAIELNKQDDSTFVGHVPVECLIKWIIF